jgi:hypothetical protein
MTGSIDYPHASRKWCLTLFILLSNRVYCPQKIVFDLILFPQGDSPENRSRTVLSFHGDESGFHLYA